MPFESCLEGVSVRRQGAKPDRERDHLQSVNQEIPFCAFLCTFMLISTRECDQTWAIFKVLLFRKPPFLSKLVKAALFMTTHSLKSPTSFEAALESSSVHFTGRIFTIVSQYDHWRMNLFPFILSLNVRELPESSGRASCTLNVWN